MDILSLKYDEAKRQELLGLVLDRFLDNAVSYSNGDITYPVNHELVKLLSYYTWFFFDRRQQELFENTEIEYSGRLTSAAGRAYITEDNAIIRISQMMIFETFDKTDRSLFVNGIESKRRLDALMRIIEHELIHILEFRIFGSSSCRGKRFKTLSYNIFGHTDVTHRLVLMHEVAQKNHDIACGSNVCFSYNGKIHKGVVANITKRATVMVADNHGDYIDQNKNRYSKFYIPIKRLKKADSRS